MKTKRELRVKWGPNATPLSCYEITIPKGHRVDGPLSDGFGRKWYFAAPAGLGIEPGSIESHDATHYGIRIAAEDVEP